jgi:hypothetical protein
MPDARGTAADSVILEVAQLYATYPRVRHVSIFLPNSWPRTSQSSSCKGHARSSSPEQRHRRLVFANDDGEERRLRVRSWRVSSAGAGVVSCSRAELSSAPLPCGLARSGLSL